MSSITKRIARNLRPISIVNGDSFKYLLSCLEPGYSVPSRVHIATVCWRPYETEKESLRNTITGKHIDLTTDIWTSAAVQGYMTLTVHFVDESRQLRSKVLLTEEIPEHHTGQNIADRLTKAADD